MSQQSNPLGPGSAGPAQQSQLSRPTTDGPVRISDIKAKLNEIDAEVREATEIEGAHGRTVDMVAVGVVVAVVVLAFLLGRKRGRRKSTWVEVRRL